MDVKGGTAGRVQWLIILGAMVLAVPMYFLVGSIITKAGPLPPTPQLPMLSRVFPVLAVAALLGAVTWAHLRMRIPSESASSAPQAWPLPEPAIFVQQSIVAIGLADASVVLGFVLVFLGGPLNGMLGYAIGTLAVLIGVILPRGLRYWSTWETRQGSHHPRD